MVLNDPKVMQMFADVGAVVTDSHFVYTSGRHGSVFINKDALYVRTEKISELCALMAASYDADEIDVVVGPALGGIVLSQWVAHHLNLRRTSGETFSVYAEKEGEGANKTFGFHRGYERFVAGKRVLIVEDILTTGGSVKKVVDLVRQSGGQVVSLSLLCNRGRVQPVDVGDAPIHALLTIDMETYTEDECPLCQQGVPINTELGKGRVFLEKQRRN